MKNLLFPCTGNYYRSRFCEEYFNHQARRHGLAWRADSRGLAPDITVFRNPGPLSPHTRQALPTAVEYFFAEGCFITEPIGPGNEKPQRPAWAIRSACVDRLTGVAP